MYEISRFNTFGKCPVAFIKLESIEVMTSHGTFYFPKTIVLLTDTFEFMPICVNMFLRTNENGRAYVWKIRDVGNRFYLTDNFNPFIYKFIIEEAWWKTLSWEKESEL